jgi:hypothetical protein
VEAAAGAAVVAGFAPTLADSEDFPPDDFSACPLVLRDEPPSVLEGFEDADEDADEADVSDEVDDSDEPPSDFLAGLESFR